MADLQLAIQALKTAVAGWNGTSVNCALQAAANIAAQIIDSIMPGSTVALIATVAIAGFDVLMSNLAPCTTTVFGTEMRQKYKSANLRATPEYAQAHAAIEDAHFWSKQHVYRNQFNGAAKESHLAVSI